MGPGAKRSFNERRKGFFFKTGWTLFQTMDPAPARPFSKKVQRFFCRQGGKSGNFSIFFHNSDNFFWKFASDTVDIGDINLQARQEQVVRD